MFRKIFAGIFLISCTSLLLCGNVGAEASEPLRQVQGLVEEIIQTLQDQHLQGQERQEERRAQIRRVVMKVFNFRLMAELALGDTWKTISVQEREQFVDLFTRLLENTYIRRVEGYSGEKVVYNNDVVKDKLALVYSLFVKNNSELSVIYKLRLEDEGKWLIYDVFIEGASIIKQYRRQFDQIIAQEHFSGLIHRLTAKVDALTN